MHQQCFSVDANCDCDVALLERFARYCYNAREICKAVLHCREICKAVLHCREICKALPHCSIALLQISLKGHRGSTRSRPPSICAICAICATHMHSCAPNSVHGVSPYGNDFPVWSSDKWEWLTHPKSTKCSVLRDGAIMDSLPSPVIILIVPQRRNLLPLQILFHYITICNKSNFMQTIKCKSKPGK